MGGEFVLTLGGGGGGGEEAVPANEEVLDFELPSSDGTADVLFLAIDRCQETLFLSLNPSIELIETTRERVELIISDTRHRRDHVGGSRFQKSFVSTFSTQGNGRVIRAATEGFCFSSRLFRRRTSPPPLPDGFPHPKSGQHPPSTFGWTEGLKN